MKRKPKFDDIFVEVTMILIIALAIGMVINIARTHTTEPQQPSETYSPLLAIVTVTAEPQQVQELPPMFETPYGWTTNAQSAERQWREWNAATPTPEPSPKPTPELPVIPQRYIDAIALCLAGEEFDNRPERKAVIAQIICNRASVWDMDIVDVLKSTGFRGYGHPSRDISADDVAVASEVLTEWYANDNAAFESGLLFFDHVRGRFVTARTYSEFLVKLKEAYAT